VATNDERALHERLDRALETIAPRPAPVEDAVRRGKAIRRRRRWLGAAAATVACAGLVAGLVVLVSARPPEKTRSYASQATGNPTVTAPDASSGVIASGTIDGRSWRLDARAPGTHGVSAEQEIVGISGPGWGDVGMYQAVPALHAPSAVPVTFSGISSPEAQAQYGAIRADVSYVTVGLSDGGVLTVHPVTLFGVRVVGFAVPASQTITEATAYSRDGEIAVAIPFNDPGGMAYFGNWLRPGQQAGPRGSRLIGSGTFTTPAPLGRQPWSATAYTGPWGVCVKAGFGGITKVSCVTDTSRPGTRLLFATIGAWQVNCGVATPAVTRIVVHRPDGSSAQVRPVMVAHQKFFAFGVSRGAGALSWTAYDGSGAVVASSAG
jgi:hypothetical protein